MKKFSIALLTAIIAGCGGGGSSPTPTVTLASVAPTVPTPVVQQPACVNPHVDSSYPDSYKGTYNIPVVQDTLPSHIERSVGLKDYKPQLPTWWEAHKVTNGCKGDEYTKILYRETLDRLQALGAEHIELYVGSNGWTIDPKLNHWTVKPESLSHSYDLIGYVAQEAKKRNLKVNLV